MLTRVTVVERGAESKVNASGVMNDRLRCSEEKESVSDWPS